MRRLHCLRPAAPRHWPRFVSAVAHYAMRMGFPDLPRDRTFDRVRAGILNRYGDTKYSEPARGFTVSDLRTIRAHLNLGIFADARDWCAAVFAFYGLLRIKEYTCSGMFRQHLSVHDWGVSLAIPFSKTALIPTAVAMVRRDDELCPLAAHRAYTRHLPPRLRGVEVPYFLHNRTSVAALTDVPSFVMFAPGCGTTSTARHPTTPATHSVVEVQPPCR